MIGVHAAECLWPVGAGDAACGPSLGRTRRHALAWGRGIRPAEILFDVWRIQGTGQVACKVPENFQDESHKQPFDRGQGIEQAFPRVR